VLSKYGRASPAGLAPTNHFLVPVGLKVYAIAEAAAEAACLFLVASSSFALPSLLSSSLEAASGFLSSFVYGSHSRLLPSLGAEACWLR
jgi:hypothetical protein